MYYSYLQLHITERERGAVTIRTLKDGKDMHFIYLFKYCFFLCILTI